jgi:hypothetical protein
MRALAAAADTHFPRHHDDSFAGIQAREVCVLLVCWILRKRHGQGVMRCLAPMFSKRLLVHFQPIPHFVSVPCQRSQTRHRQGMKPKIVRLLMVRNYVSLVLSQAIGQFHVEIFADGLSDVNEAEVRTKIKKSGGADYDQGSNAGGSAYTTSAGDIKAQAKGTFLSKEKETNIGPVIFEKSALPQTTPIDLKGRPMVAPPTEAMRNVNHTGNLDVDKFKGKVSVVSSGSGGDVAPAAPAAAPAPAPVSVEDPVQSAVEAASALTLAQAEGEAAPAEE